MTSGLKKTLTLAALAPLALIGLSGADTNTPAPQGLLASIEAGQPMRLDYQIKASAWVLFIPITGKASFTVDMNAENYTMRSKVKTTGLADALVNYDMDIAATGYTTPTGLNTYAYTSQNTDGKKDRRVELKYKGNDFDMVATPAFGNLGDPPATTAQVLQSKDPITALISFGLEPRDLNANPCGGPMKIFDGRQLTHLNFDYKGTKKVKSDAWKGTAYECHVRMDKVAGYKKGEVNRDTLSGITGPIRMWLAPLPNGTTMPVRIEAETDKIGTVVLQASRLNFTPLEK